MRTTFKTRVTDADSGVTNEAIFTVVSVESVVLVARSGGAIYGALIAMTMDGSPMITVHGPFDSEDDAERFLQRWEDINARRMADGKSMRLPQPVRNLSGETRREIVAAIMGAPAYSMGCSARREN
jgi:hypothetical protein